MFSFLPLIENKSFGLKILWLFILVSIFFLATTLIGILLAIPIFGRDILEILGSIENLDDLRVINFQKYFQFVSQLGIFIFPSISFAWFYNRKVSVFFRINSFPKPLLFVIAFFAILSFIPALNFLLEINQGMVLPDYLSPIEQWMKSQEEQLNKLTEAFLFTDSYFGLITNLIIMAIVAAIGEELLFRGVVLRLLEELFNNIHLAVIFSAIAFSALHMQFYGFLPRMVIGIFFGYIFIWTRNLWIPIFLHFVFNSISILAAFAYKNGWMKTNLEDFGTSNDNLLIILSFSITFFLFLLIYKKRESVRSSLI